MLTTKISSKWTNAVPSLSDPRRYPTDDMGRRRSGGHAALASVEALQIAVKREVKSKGEKERYTHLNAEFQRIAWRDKKTFSDQCKETEENNRMGKTRDFKKIRDTKGTFYAKMSTIKDRNGMDLTEAGDIKKKWQEYKEEPYKKDPNDPDNNDGVITPRARHPGV